LLSEDLLGEARDAVDDALDAMDIDTPLAPDPDPAPDPAPTDLANPSPLESVVISSSAALIPTLEEELAIIGSWRENKEGEEKGGDVWTMDYFTAAREFFRWKLVIEQQQTFAKIPNLSATEYAAIRKMTIEATAKQREMGDIVRRFATLFGNPRLRKLHIAHMEEVKRNAERGDYHSKSQVSDELNEWMSAIWEFFTKTQFGEKKLEEIKKRTEEEEAATKKKEEYYKFEYFTYCKKFAKLHVSIRRKQAELQTRAHLTYKERSDARKKISHWQKKACTLGEALDAFITSPVMNPAELHGIYVAHARHVAELIQNAERGDFESSTVTGNEIRKWVGSNTWMHGGAFGIEIS
jgi:hypothetical protein